jgi:hypothetical protein
VFKDGLLERPIIILGFRVPEVNDTLGVKYDSNEYTLEFHPSRPSLVIVEESIICILDFLFNLFSIKLNVPLPDSPFRPTCPCEPVSPFSPCSPRFPSNPS